MTAVKFVTIIKPVTNTVYCKKSTKNV